MLFMFIINSEEKYLVQGRGKFDVFHESIFRYKVYESFHMQRMHKQV